MVLPIIKSISHGIYTDNFFIVPGNTIIVTFGEPGYCIELDYIGEIWNIIKEDPENIKKAFIRAMQDGETGGFFNLSQKTKVSYKINGPRSSAPDLILDYSTTQKADNYEKYSGLYSPLKTNSWDVNHDAPMYDWGDTVYYDPQADLLDLNYKIKGKFICLSELVSSIGKGVIFVFACKEKVNGYCKTHKLNLTCCKS